MMNKSLRCLVLSSLILITQVGLDAHALEPDQVFKKVSPSVWLVRTFDAEGVPLSAGSAVVVEPHRLLTNCHVLNKGHAVSVIKEKTSFKAKLEFVDVERDMCMLSVTDERFDAPVASLATEADLSVGERVVALGNPQVLEMTLSDGLISRLQRDPEGHLEDIQTSAPVSPGSSGGGLFDMQGRLIGITQRVLTGASVQNLNFAVPIMWLADLPERSRKSLDEYYATRNKHGTNKN